LQDLKVIFGSEPKMEEWSGCGMETFAVLTEADGLANNSVWSIHEDINGTLWFGHGERLDALARGEVFQFKRLTVW